MAKKMDLTKYLCCPVCQGNLERRESSLLCRRCNHHYRIKEKIPILIHPKDFSRQYKKEIDYFTDYKDFRIEDYKLEEWHKSFLRRFKENVFDLKGKIVLDCGIGQGYMTIELAREKAFLIACDLTFACLRRLKKIAEKNNFAGRILFVCCSMEALPVKSKSIDYFIANAVLEHLEREKEAVLEICRVCKKSAGLMLTVPHRYLYLNPLFIPYSFFQDKIIGHLRRYDEPILKQKLLAFGGRLKKIYYTGHFSKVVITKLLTEIFNNDRIAKIGENLDKKSERKKYGASNLCAFFQRE